MHIGEVALLISCHKGMMTREIRDVNHNYHRPGGK